MFLHVSCLSTLFCIYKWLLTSIKQTRPSLWVQSVALFLDYSGRLDVKLPILGKRGIRPGFWVALDLFLIKLVFECVHPESGRV